MSNDKVKPTPLDKQADHELIANILGDKVAKSKLGEAAIVLALRLNSTITTTRRIIRVTICRSPLGRLIPPLFLGRLIPPPFFGEEDEQSLQNHHL